MAGAALSTIFAQLIATILCYIYILRRIPILVSYASLSDITRINCSMQLKVGIPMGAMNFIIAIGSTVLQFSLNRLGSDAVAAYTGATKIDPFGTNILASIGIAVGTFVAQNYGAKQYTRIKEGTKKIAIIFICYSIAMGLFMIFFGPSIVNDVIGPVTPDILEMCQTYFIINGCCYFILCILYITRYSLQGIGFHKILPIAGFIETIMRILTSILALTSIGFISISLASPLAWFGSSIPLCYFFFKFIRNFSPQKETIEE